MTGCLPRPSRRPFFVTIVTLGVLILATVNLAQAGISIARWEFYIQLGLSIPLPLIVASGLVWGSIWLAAAWQLWKLVPGSIWLVPILLAAHTLFRGAMRVVFAQDQLSSGSVGLSVIIGLAAATLIYLGFSAPAVRSSFDPTTQQVSE